MICIDCKVDIPKILTGQKRKAGDYVYIDDTGRKWHRKRCPDCWAKFLKEARVPKTGRRDGVGLLGPAAPFNKKAKIRNCRACGVALPRSRYFLHVECTPKVEFWDMSECYEYVG